jgi:hypothetical protein
MRKKHNLFQLGVIGVIFVYFIFSLVFEGQDWMKKLYYVIIPLSFLLMVLGYERQNSLIRLGRNALVVCVAYNFLKLIGIIDYDFEGMKLQVPIVVMITIIFQVLIDVKNGNLHLH